MKKIHFLTTKTLHHLYFFKRLEKKFNINKILIETKSVLPKFKVGPTYEKKRYNFEKKFFFKNKKFGWPTKKIISSSSINAKKILNFLSKDKPDLGIVFGTRKITPEIIKCFKDGLINIHRGKLDQYRGLDTDLWAIYHNDFKNIFLTIHKVEKDLDNGSIFFEKKMNLNKNLKTHKIQYFTTLMAVTGVLKFLKKYTTNKKIKLFKRKKGRYYSFMPYDLRKIVIKKFDNYYHAK